MTIGTIDDRTQDPGWIKRTLVLIKNFFVRLWFRMFPKPNILTHEYDSFSRLEKYAVVTNLIAQSVLFGLWYGGDFVAQTIGSSFRGWAITVTMFPAALSLEFALMAVLIGRRRGRSHWLWSNGAIYSAAAFAALVSLDFYKVITFGEWLHAANAVVLLFILQHLSQPVKRMEKVYSQTEYDQATKEKALLLSNMQDVQKKLEQTEQEKREAQMAAKNFHNQLQSGLRFDNLEQAMVHAFRSGKLPLLELVRLAWIAADENQAEAARYLDTTRQTVNNYLKNLPQTIDQ